MRAARRQARRGTTTVRRDSSSRRRSTSARPPGASSRPAIARPGESARPVAAPLSRELAELQFDLGGIAYEMAVRDHWRLDVLVRRAARLQEVDAQLAGAERLARTDGGAAVGTCPACGALHARGAAFCSHCGAALGPVSISS